MTRDYKPAPRSQRNAGKGSVFFTGFLFGLAVGVAASVAVALLVKGGDSPFAVPQSAPRIDAAPQAGAESVTPPADDASRYDFYKILPGNESQIPGQEAQPREAGQPAAPATPVETYYLQVGAFQSELDADNLKAQLALLGMEALVQTVEVPGKGNLHRVRVGPYASLEQIARMRTLLAQNGFSAELVKTQNQPPDQ